MRTPRKPPYLRKPRSDSPLRMLAAERQEEIITYLEQHSHAETLAWLLQKDLKVSSGALSMWYSWWLLRRRSQQDEATVISLIDNLRRRKTRLSEEELYAIGQESFNLLAIRNQDSETWARLQHIRQREKVVSLAQQKFQRETCELFLKWRDDQKAMEIADSRASNAEKIEKLGRLMFGKHWEDPKP
jgi:proteasome lid subunit RPN8/RPN11